MIQLQTLLNQPGVRNKIHAENLDYALDKLLDSLVHLDKKGSPLSWELLNNLTAGLVVANPTVGLLNITGVYSSSIFTGRV